MPLDNGSKEIRALDGLRAIAALSIVVFHGLHAADFQHNAISRITGNFFWYLPTGVHLFFVLSGFLLFLPYVRALLLDRPFPSPWRFYRRRALRILPAYLVALMILSWLSTTYHSHPVSGGSIVAHVLMIHDMFPRFNRDIEGPFWTLAVEVQFYLLLPFMAAALAWMMGRSRSPRRLLSGIVLLMAAALGLRALDIALTNAMPANTSDGFARAFVLATMGMQGKYLEVFMTGMLTSVAYVVSVESGRLPLAVRQRLGWGALWAATVVILLAIPHIRFGGTIFAPGQHWGVGVLVYPLVVGVGYATLLLSILWGCHPIRWLCETPPMRFVGLISYSLYLWHDPLILSMIPVIAGAPLLLRIACAFPMAYLSYQLVERPFLTRRRRAEKPKKPEHSARSSAPVPEPVPEPAPALVEAPAAAALRLKALSLE